MKTFKNALGFAMMAAAVFAVSSASVEAREIKVQRKAVVATTVVEPAEIAANTPVAWTAAPVQASPIVMAAPAVPACARKVKVIYAGYGEATRAAPCAIASN